jgi:ribonucleoside-diphosphate reductase alpha chain
MSSSFFVDQFSEQIWNQKYRGRASDVVAYYSGLGKMMSLGNEKDAVAFTNLMLSKSFSPGGRILALAGRPDAKMSLMNCTTHTIEDDSLESISEAAYTIMRASSRGQGIGVDLSNLRPKNSPVSNAAKTSTGAISFMEMLGTVGATIGQEGRRAALLFSMSVDHPDIYRGGAEDLLCPSCGGSTGCKLCEYTGYIPYDFLHVKRIPGKVENANISVRITDTFMVAVENDDEWILKYEGRSGGYPFEVTSRGLRARDLFHVLAKSAWESAEPGVLYWDTSQRMSNSDLFGSRWKVVGNNACTEQVLDQDGVCLLGSINLANYIIDPYTKDAQVNYGALANDIPVMVKFLDNVVDVELQFGNYISNAQKESLQHLRRIGLGVMGLADMLASLRLPYSSDPMTIETVRNVFSSIRNNAYTASINLAKVRGPAYAWEETESYYRDIVNNGRFYSKLPEYIKRDMYKYGTRNVAILSIAPTGTISNLLGVSSGIEPVFAHQYKRRTRMSGRDEFVDYIHPGVQKAREAGLPDSIYPTAYEVTPHDHLLIQAVIQNYVDSSISKTVNLPASATIADVENIYRTGWEWGLKGISLYRDGSREMQVLYSHETGDEKELCPECKGELVNDSGCILCSSCGYSLCSI